MADARIVILGASNVARGIGTIVETVRELFGSRVEIMTAMGHGRSYGLMTSIPFRALPSIHSCGLWRALAERPPLPTWSLFTDLGNDLIYGCSAGQVIEWIDECATRLRCTSQGMLITGLPLSSVLNVGLLRFHAFRNLLFPKSKMKLAEGQGAARALDEAARQLALKHSAEFLIPEARWYGVDPIHIRFAVQREAWRAIFSALTQKVFSPPTSTRSSWREWWRTMQIRPEQSHVFAQPRVVPQPSLTLHDGITVSFY